MTAANKKQLTWLLKTAILVLTYVFIHHEYLKRGKEIRNFENLMRAVGHTQIIIVMSLVVGLMLVNWLLEAMKWQYLVRHLEPISYWRAIECVFCGLTWAVFTPNRLGEYGGRVMFLPPRKRIHGAFAMTVGALGQNVLTNVLGSIGAMWFVVTFLKLNFWIVAGIWFLSILNITIFLVLFFNIKWLVWVLDRTPLLKKYHRFFDIIGNFSKTELVDIMLFCLARFSAFSCQYYILIHLFIPQIPLYEILLLTFIVFIIQSALPSLDLVDVAVRSAVSAIVFGYVTNQTVAVIAVFSAIWLINLIIPAILGTVFNLKLNFFDRNS